MSTRGSRFGISGSMSSHAVAKPSKKGGVWKWRNVKYESHAAKHRKNIDIDRLNDLTVYCSDGKQVKCQSYMLRVASEVFDEMLGGDDFDPKKGLVCPRFSSNVIETVKYYCHLGCIPTLQPSQMTPMEMDTLLDVLVAADFYDLDELGAMCLGHTKKNMEKRPNLAFAVAAKFGLSYKEEDRTMVASAMFFASSLVGNFQEELLSHPSISAISMLRHRATLKSILDLMPMTSSEAFKDVTLLPLQFMHSWVAMTGGEEEEDDATNMARELLKETNFLKKIAAVRPDHLIDPEGMIRASDLVDKENVMDAIYSLRPGYCLVQPNSSAFLTNLHIHSKEVKVMSVEDLF
ncbi:expressed unknown protein [Seminavis robusta]|uniref:BTB domain-containing protein n=1 Tax=Seminavis robusta TaxID=568900 RepID=A0A9N8DD77_9STRA|nr:expressed unknown protein [Seminavis robusta]|eukprot:Sro41_g025000.1 n/a (348) ;mRNA; f:3330-4373